MISSLSSYLFFVVLILTNVDEDQLNGYMENLSTLIDLSTVVILEFKEHNNLPESHVASCILRYERQSFQKKYLILTEQKIV